MQNLLKLARKGIQELLIIQKRTYLIIIPMEELIVASRNRGKVAEIKDLLAGLPFQVTSLLDYPHVPEIIEDGKTYRANAMKKAGKLL